ncbi:uncharacterized protein A1O9_10764 [Exophiala aquamarina CBS 119918]|uniref:Peroxin-19 n=1 Tax=Exophiala aquamarina CBS 119918 TaxID=1182545 RepID=A0A072P0H7_9EURO|nr:uncharacterized protein A1O9_10764 [Exophiala aquamarina CBS 119918]KEF53316.1 hypothetical protein A1O9_10764 [Exophiala aquamarina CBS 119918]
MAEPTKPTESKPPDVAVEDDSDPDFDDLDDVLDQFSAATSSQPMAAATKSPQEPIPSSSGPGRPTTETTAATAAPALPPDIPIPPGPKPNESEDEFLERLTAEMSSVMSKFSMDPAASAASPEDIAKMGQELEEFTQRMEAQGVQPEDMLKAILGEDAGNKVVDVAEQERDRRESQSKSRSPEKSRANDETSSTQPSSSKPKSGSKSKAKSQAKPADSFEDTIRKTMARMESSSAAASGATQKSAAKSEEDMLAEMLRALDSEGGGGAGGSAGSEGDLSKMFLGMMEQLTNKEMLYEPMKELSTKYPTWLDENKPPASKLAPAEYERFTRQRVIVDEIVAKFEEKGYSDDNPQCREFIWEKMQQMQGEGAPPEDLVANPFPGMGMPGLGLGDGPDGMEDGCPTQ